METIEIAKMPTMKKPMFEIRWVYMIRSIFSLVCGLGLLISLCSATWASQNTCPAQKKRYVDYFLHLYAAELFRNQSFVLNKSWGYVTQDRLECVGMHFSCYKAMTVDQSRRMIVDLINQLLERINADTEMKARHLVNEPFYAKRLRLEIRTDNIFSENSDVASVRIIRFNGSELVYESYPKSTIYSGGPRVLCRETFEDALMKLDDAALLEQPDNPLRRPLTLTPWTGNIYSPEMPSFALPEERVKKMQVAEEEFAQGINLSAPKRELVQEEPFIPGSSTKETIFPSDTIPNFYQDQQELPFQVPVFHHNAFLSERKICFSSSSFPEYASTSFGMTPSHAIVTDGFKVDVSLNDKPCSLQYGTWKEGVVSFGSESRYAPPGGWVSFAFYDALSKPSGFSGKNIVSMVDREFPSHCLSYLSRWKETSSLLEREAGVSPVSYTLLSSSALPEGQKEKHQREDDRWNGLASIASPVPQEKRMYVAADPFPPPTRSFSGKGPVAAQMIAFSPLPEGQTEKHQREDDCWNGLVGAIPLNPKESRALVASRTLPVPNSSFKGSASLTYTMLASSSLPLAQKRKQCREIDCWNGFDSTQVPLPQGRRVLMASNALPPSQASAPRQGASVVSFSALAQNTPSHPVFCAMREVACSFTSAQQRMASRITMATSPQSAFFARKEFSGRVMLAQKNAIQEKKAQQYVSGRASSLDTSSSFFALPAKHVSPAETFVAQAKPVKESPMLPTNSPREEQEEELRQEELKVPQDLSIATSQDDPSLEASSTALSMPSQEDHSDEQRLPNEEEPEHPQKSPVSAPLCDEKTDAESQKARLQILKKSIRSFAAKSAADVITRPRLELYPEETNTNIAQVEEETVP